MHSFWLFRGEAPLFSWLRGNEVALLASQSSNRRSIDTGYSPVSILRVRMNSPRSSVQVSKEVEFGASINVTPRLFVADGRTILRRPSLSISTWDEVQETHGRDKWFGPMAKSAELPRNHHDHRTNPVPNTSKGIALHPLYQEREGFCFSA